MSAFVALWHLDGRPVEDSKITAMLATMPHRSPDGTHQVSFGDVTLGHGLLVTTPEALRERQPFDTGSAFGVSADLRLDNLQELRGTLRTGSDSGDAENLLAAYRRWGTSAFDRLEGDFAGALWDGGRGTLVCMRDVIGAKPIYYTHSPGTLFAVATEPKALLALPEVDSSIDPVRLADYLALMREDAVSTTFKSIKRLPPGHFLVITREGLTIERYASLGPDPGVPALTDEMATERFKNLLFESVRARMRTSHPLGSQLSGGLDSSAITCIARAVRAEAGNPEPIHTFSLIFDDRAADERQFIQTVIDQGGVEPHFIHGEEIGVFDNLDRLCEIIDDGLPGGTQHLVWALLAKAGEVGTRVVLDGIDGDQVVGHGGLRLKELAEEDRWEELAAEVLALEERYSAIPQRQNFEDTFADRNRTVREFVLPVIGRRAEVGDVRGVARAIEGMNAVFGSSKRMLWRVMARKLVVPDAIRRWRRHRRESKSASRVPPLIDPQFARSVDYAKRYGAVDAALTFDAVRSQQRQLLSSPRLTTALEITDHFAAANGVEVRHPFLDRRLISCALALPPELSLQNGWTRFVLRRAIEDVAPAEVTWRVGKALMAPSFARSLFNESGSTVLSQTFDDLGGLAPIVNRAEIDRLSQQRANLSEEDQGRALEVAILATWVQRRGYAVAKTISHMYE